MLFTHTFLYIYYNLVMQENLGEASKTEALFFRNQQV